MDNPDCMARSIELAVAAIRGAEPAGFDGPTPCSEYSLGQLVNHLAFGFLLAERAADRQEWDEGWSGTSDAPFLAGQPPRRWAELAAEQGAATTKAWADPQVWTGETTFGGGAMPAAAIGSMMIAEFAVHGWDVARASGQEFAVPAELGDVVLEGVAALAQMGRDGGWYGPEVEAPAGADAFTRALALSGRDPR